MTKEDTRNKSLEIVDELFQQVKSKIDPALNSGCIDFDSYENNYLLPKIIAEAALRDVYERNLPQKKEWRKEIENIYRCL